MQIYLNVYEFNIRKILYFNLYIYTYGNKNKEIKNKRNKNILKDKLNNNKNKIICHI